MLCYAQCMWNAMGPKKGVEPRLIVPLLLLCLDSIGFVYITYNETAKNQVKEKGALSVLSSIGVKGGYMVAEVCL